MWTYRAVVVRWIDGDTVVVNIDQGFRDWKHDQALRLTGPPIDAPDNGPGKEAARAFCDATWPPGTELTIRTEQDKLGNERQTFDRYLAEAWAGSVSVAGAILAAGHAKPYVK